MTNGEDQENWNHKLKIWLEENPERRKELRRVVSKEGLYCYTSGKTKTMAKMGNERRAQFYAVTGIDDFRFDGYETYLPKGNEPQVIDSGSNGLENLAKQTAALALEVKKLGGHYNPTVDERVSSVNDALATIYDHMQYFADEKTSSKDRERLANSIDGSSFGLIWNVLEGILKDPNSPEVFARKAMSQGFWRPRS